MRFAALALALSVASTGARAEEPSAQAAPSTDAAPGAASGAAESGPAGPSAAGPAGTPAPSGEAAPGAAPTAAPAPATPPPASGGGESQWGVLVDAGLPQGVTLSATFRPTPSVRFFAGPAWNYVGFGIQGGVSLAPWHLAVTPVLTAEAGRYFGENVSFIAKGGQGVPPDLSSLMKDMTYTYGAIGAGIEFGSQDGFAFTLGLGLAYVALDAKGTVTKTDASGSTVTFRDPRVRATLPSLKFGVHYWF